ncbi:PREDICTED: talin-1-like, partial [Phaethon lepturus]|uniref:talin-1-like n=1 Tax=Phaethon lepturus TaxID=97097 RepID=UPI00053063A0
MVALSLKISIGNVVKTVQFEPSTMVYDACWMIHERVPEAQMGQPNDFGLFLLDEDTKKGIWLETGKTLEYYMLRNGDTMEYKKKQRPLKICMLDGTVKTVMVDDSKTVMDMLMTICARIGITNYDEYSLVREIMEEKKEEVTGTLKKDKTLLRDEKMEKLKQKLHTDDELNWLDHGWTLREYSPLEHLSLLPRASPLSGLVAESFGWEPPQRALQDAQLSPGRDFLGPAWCGGEWWQGCVAAQPTAVSLLPTQARDDILNGSHPVSFDKACKFASYQCQI